MIFTRKRIQLENLTSREKGRLKKKNDNSFLVYVDPRGEILCGGVIKPEKESRKGRSSEGKWGIE